MGAAILEQQEQQEKVAYKESFPTTFRPCIQTPKWKFYNYYRDKYMILYYFPIAQNKTFSDFFQRCICLFAHIFLIFFLFTGQIPV